MPKITWKQLVHDAVSALKTASHSSEKIEIGTLSDKIKELPKGLYIWEKSKVSVTVGSSEPIIISNPTFQVLTLQTNIQWIIRSDDFDVHNIDVTFFEGFVCYTNKGNYSITKDTTGNIKFNNKILSYDPITAVLTCAATSGLQIFNASYSGTKTASTPNLYTYTFEKYEIANNPTIYPDDGIVGEYRYRKIKGITPETFGFKNMNYGTIKYTGTTYDSNIINHGLNSIPKLILFYYPEENPEINWISAKFIAIVNQPMAANHMGGVYWLSGLYRGIGSTGTAATGGLVEVTDTYFRIIYGSSLTNRPYFIPNVTYHWFAFN